MNKQVAKELKACAEEVALRFSNSDRPRNTNAETFQVDHIKPLSESVAVVRFLKSTGKYGLAVFYYIRTTPPKWMYFFPTDSHLLGFQRLADMKLAIEEQNWERNFD